LNPIFLITGGTGRLGRALAAEFHDALIPAHTELELTSTSSVRKFLSRTVPDIVIHTAAFTDVRSAEARREYCWKLNVDGTERIVEGLLCYSPSCYFVHISSPCVFRGDTVNYTESSIPGPSNFYGLGAAHIQSSRLELSRMRKNSIGIEPSTIKLSCFHNTT